MRLLAEPSERLLALHSLRASPNVLAAFLLIVSCVSAGIGIGTGVPWLIAPALLILLAACLATRAERMLMAVLLVVLPLVPSGQRLPLLGLRSWQVALVILAILIGCRSVRSLDKFSDLRFTLVDFFACVLFVALAVSFSVSNVQGNTSVAFGELILVPAGMFVAGRIAYSDPHPERWPAVVLAGAILAALEIWLEFRLGHPLFDTALSDPEGGWLVGFRAGSMLQGPNFAAAYLSLALAGFLPLLSRRKVPWQLGIVLAITIASTLFATRSISGTIEITAVLMGLLIARRHWMAFTVIVAGVVLLASPPVWPQVAALEWFASHGQSISTRFDLLEVVRTAVPQLATDPLTLVLGIGYGEWQSLGGRFAFGNNIPSGAYSLENTYLTLLIESGVPALASFIALVAAGVSSAWRNPQDRLCLGGGLAALALAIASGAGTVTSIPQVFGLALFLLASTAAPNRMRNSDRGAQLSRAPQSATLSVRPAQWMRSGSHQPDLGRSMCTSA